jgi:hypothetical protein
VTRSASVLALLAGASILIAAGCARQLTPSLTYAEIPLGCALGLPGSSVVAEDIEDGIALVFTSRDRPEEMRERARDAAAQHGPYARMGRSHEGRHAQGTNHGLQMSQGPVARTVTEDVEGGARIQLVAVDPAEAEALRARLRKQAVALNAMKCTETGLTSHPR